jgi:hypothetical protein
MERRRFRRGVIMIDILSSPEALFYFRHYQDDFNKKFPTVKVEEVCNIDSIGIEVSGEIDNSKYLKFLDEKRLAEDSLLFRKRETQLL